MPKTNDMKRYESYVYNPFNITGIEHKQIQEKQDKQQWQLKDGDDIYAVSRIPKNKQILTDKTAYTKLFNDNLQTLMKLSGTGLKLLVYAACTIRPLSQTIALNIEDIQTATGMSSPNTIRTAVSELLEAKIIAKKTGSTVEYWINPNVFFNGNRLRLL